MNYLNLNIKTSILNPEIIHFETIDSTNTFLLNRNEFKNGTVVLADFQTTGRGRRGRSWLSEPGQSLLFSTLLTGLPPGINLHGFTFATSIGVTRGLQEFAENKPISVKWPNDVLLNHRKVCGILVETKTSGNLPQKIVVGVGINVNQPPEFFSGELRFGTSLFAETGRKADRIKVLKSVIKEIDKAFADFLKNGFQHTITIWKQLCPYIGKEITIDTGKSKQTGIFRDVNNEGALVLETGNKIRTYFAGDVSIAKEKAYAPGN